MLENLLVISLSKSLWGLRPLLVEVIEINKVEKENIKFSEQEFAMLKVEINVHVKRENKK